MPDWRSALASRLAALKLRPAREREIIDEVCQHLDDRYLELCARGVPHNEALHLALDEIDDDDLFAREMRGLRQAASSEPVPPGAASRGPMGGLGHDLQFALRMLRKSPGFAAAAILTLALGIGANTAIFSLVNATLLRRLPVQNRERLVYVFNGRIGNVFSYPAYAALRDGTHQLAGLAAWGPIGASLNADGETDQILGSIVTGRLFELLGVTAERGRLLGPADDVTPGGHPVAVISHRLWQGRFAGRPDIVGHEIRLNGRVFTIVGVANPKFPGPQLGSTRDVYVPMMMQALMRPPRAGYSGEMNPDLLKNPNNSWLYGLGLLKPGVTLDQARAELGALLTTYVRALSASANARPQVATLVPIDEGDPNERQQMRSAATLLGWVVGTVLLIACANVANLLLSKAAARRREVAIRLALGASRWRIVRQLLTESVLLAAIGGSLGLLIAWTVVQSFRAAPPPPNALPIAIDFSVDRRVLLFSLALSMLTGIVFGIAPALKASSPGLVPALKDESFAVDERARRFGLKKGLVVAQVALAVLLLIAAGLFVRSLRSVQSIDPGFAAGEIVTAPLNVNLLRYTKAQGREFYRRTIERMEQLPGVTAASIARVPVLTGGGRVASILVEGRTDSGNRLTSEGSRQSTDAGQTAFANVIGPGFFKTLGIALLRGRDFTADDTEERPLVAIVSETFVKQFFAGDDPLGKRFSTGFVGPTGQWTEIVGIARDSKYATLAEASTPVVYMPLAQRHETGVTLYVRSSIAPDQLVGSLRREIQGIEPNLPVPNIQTMTETIATSLYASRMGASLLSVFGLLALLLASLGVYGVLAFSISRRRRELAIRMALGADRRRVCTLVIREGMGLVGIGLAIGLGAGLYASQAVKSFLIGVGARDLTTFASVPIVLAGVALVACYLPARRAMKVDPMVALRDS